MADANQIRRLETEVASVVGALFDLKAEIKKMNALLLQILQDVQSLKRQG